MYRPVVLDVNFSASLGDNALDGFPARTDERADLLRINFDRLDAGRVFRELRPRLLQCAAHDLENFRARFLCPLNRLRHDLVTNAWQFQVQLKTGHAVVCSAKLEVHVAKMIFRTDDVGQQFVALQLPIVTVFGNKADGDSRDHALHRHAGVHEREHSAAHARHRGRAV